jgi:hypothetical protein
MLDSTPGAMRASHCSGGESSPSIFKGLRTAILGPLAYLDLRGDGFLRDESSGQSEPDTPFRMAQAAKSIQAAPAAFTARLG